MESFEAIDQKIGELQSVRLEYEIKLRELAVEIATYENAKTLILFGSLDKPTEEKNESVEPDNNNSLEGMHNPYQTGGMLCDVTNRLFTCEKRPYSISEIADIMNFKGDSARILGVNLSGASRKKNCYFRIDFDINGNPQRAVYGLIQFKHLYKLHPKNLKEQKTKIKKINKSEANEPEVNDPPANPFKIGGNLNKAYKQIWESRRKMSITELMTACNIPDDERKNFGNKMALAGTEQKGFMRIGVGFYGILIHEHLYDV